MVAPILATKLYNIPPRPKIVLRPRLVEQLNEGLQRRLTILSAPAGFGKTMLAADWVAGCGVPAAWLSLDEGDNHPARFLMYLVAALQTLAPKITCLFPSDRPSMWMAVSIFNDSKHYSEAL